MKTLIVPVCFLVTLAFGANARADAGGKCHFHGSKPAAESTVLACATQRKETLIKSGKLDASWQSVAPARPETVDGKKGKEWKVTFANPAAADNNKRTLYMFFTPPGNFIAANFTGK